ncbi:MAG TPA: YrdB family protein [Actinomycetota bacterium]|nr:YrdB family protein [Actinomycetota bacterium]
MSGPRGLVLTVRFLCELGMLAALMVWGFHVGEGSWAFVLGIGASAVAAAVWATFVAPKALRPVRLALRVSIEIDLFTISGVALWFAGYPAWAVTLVALGIATSLANAWQEGRGDGAVA